MELFENLCETGPDAVYGFARNQLNPPSLGEVNSEKMSQYSGAVKVFEKLNDMSGSGDSDYGIRTPDAAKRKNGAGNILCKKQDEALFCVEDRKFLTTLSELFEKVDQASVYTYDDADTGNVVLAVDWSVEDVYI